MSKQRLQFKPYQIVITISIMILAGLNACELLLRGISPITLYRDTIFKDGKKYQIYRDSCMIVYSIIDCLTAFSILIMFYLIAKQ